MNERQFWAIARETVLRSRLPETAAHRQHGSTSVLGHSLAVAYFSHTLARKLGRLGLRFSTEELVRGALLHDYFLYDWHQAGPGRPLHGLRHPQSALENALAEFDLTWRERDIIQKHMFPLTPVPPACREALLVCLVDKGCAIYESLRDKTYPKLGMKLAFSFQS